MAEDKNLALKLEGNLKNMLKDVDGKMKRFVRGFEDIYKAAIKAVRPLEVDSDDSCNVSSGALPVSVAMRAVDYGIARVALRAMPKMAEEFLTKNVLKLVKQGGILLGSWTAARVLGKKIPVVGDLLTILSGYSDEKTFNDRFQELIRASLGCSPSAYDKAPMKYAINARMARTVERDNQDKRVSRKVRTRRKYD